MTLDDQPETNEKDSENTGYIVVLNVDERLRKAFDRVIESIRKREIEI